jgi:putative heme-binding domain-containing protein
VSAVAAVYDRRKPALIERRYSKNRMMLNAWFVAISLFQAAAAQAPVTNPVSGDREAIRAGSALYAMRCASCHGSDAKGATAGSDLTAIWSAGGKDQPLFQSIRRGLPNTLKPHSFGPDKDIWAVLAYLRTLDSGTSGLKPGGNAENGERVFRENCIACHQVNGRGGRLGPDLSRVASTRMRPVLAHKIRHASSYIMSVYAGGFVIESYLPVTLVTRTGQRIRGVKKNEDAFSIQIMDTQERLQGYLKANLREFVNEETSLMPDFGPDRLPDRDLDDLLAYLGAL